MTADQIYKTLRLELTDLAAGLTPDDLATPVAALPGWTVQDTIAHLTGASADVADGYLIDVKDPHWSARHVGDRKDQTINEILAEWTERGPNIDELLAYDSRGRMIFLVFDIWHHTQDIRNTLARPAGREDQTTTFITHTMAELNQRSWAKHPERPTLTLTTPTGTWQLGNGDPIAHLATTDYELARTLIGRRTHDQMLAADWTGDPTTVITHLPAFGPPTEDLHE